MNKNLKALHQSYEFAKKLAEQNRELFAQFAASSGMDLVRSGQYVLSLIELDDPAGAQLLKDLGMDLPTQNPMQDLTIDMSRNHPNPRVRAAVRRLLPALDFQPIKHALVAVPLTALPHKLQQDVRKPSPLGTLPVLFIAQGMTLLSCWSTGTTPAA